MLPGMRPSAIRARLAYAGLLAAEVGATALLLVLGRHPRLAAPTGGLARWLEVTPPADAVAALARLVALGICGWLVLTTVAGLLARLARLRHLVRGIDLVSLPLVRRLAQRATSVAVAGSLALPGTALAAPGPPPPAASVPTATAPDAEAPETTVPQTTVPQTVAAMGVDAPMGFGPGPPGAAVSDRGPDAPPPAVPEPAVAEAAGPAPRASDTYVVVPGDSFWTIAARRVAEQRGVAIDDLAPADVHDTWSSLVAANLASLPSGDADLIHPGDVLVLPPAPHAG